jgi:hypothetical protein
MMKQPSVFDVRIVDSTDTLSVERLIAGSSQGDAGVIRRASRIVSDVRQRSSITWISRSRSAISRCVGLRGGWLRR